MPQLQDLLAILYLIPQFFVLNFGQAATFLIGVVLLNFGILLIVNSKITGFLEREAPS